MLVIAKIRFVNVILSFLSVRYFFGTNTHINLTSWQKYLKRRLTNLISQHNYMTIDGRTMLLWWRDLFSRSLADLICELKAVEIKVDIRNSVTRFDICYIVPIYSFGFFFSFFLFVIVAIFHFVRIYCYFLLYSNRSDLS